MSVDCLKLCILAYLIASSASQGSFFDKGAEVLTPTGIVFRGLRVPLVTFASPDIRSPYTAVDSFLGIPFAQPPIGPLRFAAPVPIKPTAKLFNAIKMSPSCPQPAQSPFFDVYFKISPFDEDCLYLNVWTPVPRSADKPLPVLVWIYGGAFTTGGTAVPLYDGKVLAASQGIIVVSMNYRVGAFGFLHTGLTTENPGNMGLLDQHLALQWVHDNIEAFGGDPNMVTIMGESAGAASVSYHLLMPESWSLFQRAIMQSGSATNAWASQTSEQAKVRAFKLAQALDCSVTQKSPNDSFKDTDIPLNEIDDEQEAPFTSESLKCLRSMRVDDILGNYSKLTTECMDFPFVPVIDGKIIREDPLVSLEKGNFKKTLIVAGSNLNESTSFLLLCKNEIYQPTDKISVTDQDLQETLDTIYFRYGNITRQAVRVFYTNLDIPKFKNSSNSNMNLYQAETFASDYFIICGVNDMLNAYTRHGQKAYGYRFNHRFDGNPFPAWMGTIHGEELFYVFGVPWKKAHNTTLLQFSSEDKLLSQFVMSMWGNFIKTGDPNIKESGGKLSEHNNTNINPEVKFYWPPYADQHSIVIDQLSKDGSWVQKTVHGPNLKSCNFQRFLTQMDTEIKKLTRKNLAQK